MSVLVQQTNKMILPFTINSYTHLKWIILCTILLTGFAIQAQNNIAVIEAQLPGLPDDTSKINNLLKLGQYYCSRENDKALIFLQEAHTLSVENNYNEGIAKSLLWQGRVYYYKDDYSLSDKYLDKAKSILESINDRENLTFYYFAKGVNFNIRGDYIHALEMFKNAFALAKETGDKKWLSTCYADIGNVLLNRHEPRKALKYLSEALEIKKQINDSLGMASNYTGIGMAYDQLGELDSAYSYVNKGLKIREKLKAERKIASSTYTLSGILLKNGEYARGAKLAQKTLTIFTKLKDDTGIIISKLRLAMAENKQGKLEAIPKAEEALQMAKEIANPNLISFAYSKLSEMYAFNHNYKESYHCLLKHKVLQDSLFTAEKERVLTEMEAKFQSEKKDNRISYLTAKNKIQQKNNILLIILVIFFAAGIILLFFLFKIKATAYRREKQLHEQENTINKQEKQLIQQEKKLLQEQLESKNRELASKALEMIRYNDAVSSIVEKLENLNHSFKDNPQALNSINDIIRDIDSNTRQNIWDEFEKVFKNIHSGFYKKLLELCPDISASEIKIAALLKLNLTTKEIAAITYKSEGGIKTTRYRLRKKLNLTGDDKLVPFLMQL